MGRPVGGVSVAGLSAAFTGAVLRGAQGRVVAAATRIGQRLDSRSSALGVR